MKIISWVVRSRRMVPATGYGGTSAVGARPSSGLNGGPVTLYQANC